jgi:hypothetical protein
MMKIRMCILFLLSACKTSEIEVPLPSVHILRPAAGRKPLAFNLGLGVAQGPDAQGMTAAVHDPEGKEINAVPDYNNDYGGFFQHGDYTTRTVIDLGVNFLERIDLGWSSTRGAYAFVNILDFNHFTFSVTPSYYESAEDNESLVSSPNDTGPTYRSRVRDKSITGIASVFLGDRTAAGANFYAGVGLHRIRVSVKDHRTGEYSSSENDGLTRLIGFGLDTPFVGLYLEEAWTKLPQRTDYVPLARSFAFGAHFLLGPSAGKGK